MKTTNRKSLTNRWGARLAVGLRVTVIGARGGEYDARITALETTGDYVRAYGARVTLDNGMTASIEDCRIPLGNPAR